MRDIRLTATESNWRLFMMRKADPAFLSFMNKVLVRDQYTCQFCGFRAQQYQEIVNSDGNYRNNRLNNLVTACSFCAQCFFLEAVGKADFGGGTLIYLPEMTQAELNGLCHILFHIMASGNDAYGTSTRDIYRSLKLRAQPVEKELGEGFNVPSLLGQALIDANIARKKSLEAQLLKNLRLLPEMNRFVAQIETWMVDGLQALVWQ